MFNRRTRTRTRTAPAHKHTWRKEGLASGEVAQQREKRESVCVRLRMHAPAHKHARTWRKEGRASGEVAQQSSKSLAASGGHRRPSMVGRNMGAAIQYSVHKSYLNIYYIYQYITFEVGEGGSTNLLFKSRREEWRETKRVERRSERGTEGGRVSGGGTEK